MNRALAGKFGKTVYGVFSGLTETMDIVDALGSALPKKLRKKFNGMLLHEKVQFLYKHYDKLDVADAVRAIIMNQLEDKLIGSLHGAKRGIADRLGMSNNWGLGASTRAPQINL